MLYLEERNTLKSRENSVRKRRDWEKTGREDKKIPDVAEVSVRTRKWPAVNVEECGSRHRTFW